MENFMLQFFGILEMIQNFLLNITREDIGYISTICLGLCSFPLVVKTIRDGHCKGLSFLALLLWLIGEVTGVIYVIPLGKLPLLINYMFNTINVAIIFVYKIRKG